MLLCLYTNNEARTRNLLNNFCIKTSSISSQEIVAGTQHVFGNVCLSVSVVHQTLVHSKIYAQILEELTW